MSVKIYGKCDERFQGVYDEFKKNFEERGEVGASVCIKIKGETVVDLWGGMANPEENIPWNEDTVSLVWSCTKGATALCAHMLAYRGLLDYDKPVAYYWPEFAQNGKENITVRMLMCHQAGLPAIRTPMPEGAFYDWDLVVNTLAAEKPFWEPGTRYGYHALTYGFLVGELVRRITGKTVGTFFKEEVAQPLGLDFWIGLPEEIEPRVAPMRLPPPSIPDPTTPFQQAFLDPESIQTCMLANTGGYLNPGECDSRAAHAAEIPAASGITNARGLAGMYAPLAMGGEINGIRLVDEATIRKMSTVASAATFEASFMVPFKFSLGYMKNCDNRWYTLYGPYISMILTESAFGHAGNGGSLGFADPSEQMSFGYTMNQQGDGIMLNDRGQSLVDAAYKALGYTSNESGAWAK